MILLMTSAIKHSTFNVIKLCLLLWIKINNFVRASETDSDNLVSLNFIIEIKSCMMLINP